MNFTDKMLIASPSIEEESIFGRALVYISEHNEEGAMGYIVNKPSDFKMKEFIKNTNLAKFLNNKACGDQPVYLGGPVATNKLQILYADDKRQGEAEIFGAEPSVQVSTSEALLREIDQTGQPHRHMFILGYSAWESKQLEKEFREDSWIMVDSVADIIFSPDAEDRLMLAAQHLGFNLDMMVTSRR